MKLQKSIFIIPIVVLFFQCASVSESKLKSEYKGGQTGLSGFVTDAETGDPLPARIVLNDHQRQTVQTYYQSYPGIYTDDRGIFQIETSPGTYNLIISRGIDYLSQSHEIQINEGQTLHLTIALESWVPLRKMGWVNGEGHAHLYTDKHPDDEMLGVVRKICRAQGVDFIATNQGWGGYNDDNWREGYAQFSDEKFLLSYGAEMPKYRTGHTWWLNLKSCRHYFKMTMDTVYENGYYQSPKAETWQFADLPFPNIPDVELIPYFKNADEAVACIAHPTSWWWQKRGDIEKYTTNVCEYLSFSLLAGNLWDGMVVMGYDKDHYFYQNLWFHVLNEGYRLTPLAELDGGYGENNKFPYGSMRVYYQVGEHMSMSNIAEAVRKGRTFVTSGPIVFADMDGQYQVGDVVPADGMKHKLYIDAYASGEIDDYLSYVIVFRNGKIHKLWDLRDEKPRHVEKNLEIIESKQAWYAIKAYGRDAWEDPKNLDVMAVCEEIQTGTFKGEIRKENSNCMTSPFYFRSESMSDPAPLESNVTLTLKHPKTKLLVKKARIDVLLNGNKINELDVTNGQVSFKMPVNAILKISSPGLPTIRRGLYLDYPPHQKMIETFASGRWLDQSNWKKLLSPGQVPWEAFQFEKARSVLSNVDWILEMKPNERDELWEEFERLFEAGTQ